VLVNQLAFPGMGTIMAGRRQPGYAQATLMLTGFFLVIGFAVWFFWCSMQALTQLNWTEARFREAVWGYAWVAIGGLGLCGVAWVWALVSSVQILQGAKPDSALRVPPRI
jgi:hypothetical protein